jgi:hypothetical protein
VQRPCTFVTHGIGRGRFELRNRCALRTTTVPQRGLMGGLGCQVVEREALHTTVVQPDLEAVRNEIRDFLCRRVTERHKDARLQGLQR